MFTHSVRAKKKKKERSIYIKYVIVCTHYLKRISCYTIILCYDKFVKKLASFNAIH